MGPARRGLESLALASLVGQVCHDLNNHLATVLGKTEIALMVSDPGRYRPALEQTLEAGQPARALVAELQRLVSWVRDGEQGVLATDAVGVATRLCERGCAKRGVRLAVRSECPGARLDDPGRVALLCWNLLDGLLQAQSASRNGSEARHWTVKVRPGPEGVRLRVETDAPGVGESPSRDGLRQLESLLPLLGGELRTEPGAVELALSEGARERGIPSARAGAPPEWDSLSPPLRGGPLG
jgi:hypothetical protein